LCYLPTSYKFHPAALLYLTFSWCDTDYSSLTEEEAEFQDLEQEVKPETSPIELKQLPLGLQYVFLNGNHETPVIIINKLSIDET
jgi:hypothetical protein